MTYLQNKTRKPGPIICSSTGLLPACLVPPKSNPSRTVPRSDWLPLHQIHGDAINYLSMFSLINKHSFPQKCIDLYTMIVMCQKKRRKIYHDRHVSKKKRKIHHDRPEINANRLFHVLPNKLQDQILMWNISNLTTTKVNCQQIELSDC